MSRNTIILIVVIGAILLGGGAILLVANHGSYNTDTMNGMDMSTGQKSATTSGTTAVATDKVSIANFAFSPKDITVKKGTTVTWTNKDGAAHTVTETDGKTGPDSDNLANGKSYSFTYNDVGTFKYHCAIHPSMTGTVTVTE